MKKGLAVKANPLILNGAGNRTRTDDLLITNQLLYQLSYPGKEHILPEMGKVFCRKPLFLHSE
jgi:hypothetical protein